MSSSTISGWSAASWPTRTMASTSAARSAGGRAAQPGQQPGRAHLVDHLLGVGRGQRRQPEAHVGQRLDVDAAQPEHHQRPEGRVALDADDHLLPAA